MTMSVKNNPNLLRKIPLFQDLSQKELGSLKSYIREKSFDKGEILFFEGEDCSRIFIVHTGRVKVFRTSASGKEQILEVLSEGDTCACNPGSATWHCSATAQALTDCRVLFLPRDHYIKLVRSNSKLSLTLNQLFAKRICRLSALIEEVSLDNPRRRLVKFILDILDDQENKSQDAYISFTHEEISQRLGLVRETVTRHLSQLKRSKLIDIQSRRIVICDKAGLKKMLSL